MFLQPKAKAGELTEPKPETITLAHAKDAERQGKRPGGTSGRQKRNSGDAAGKQKKPRIPKSVRDTIRYTRMLEDGLCEIMPGQAYSKTIVFDDVNYTDLSDNMRAGIFDRYAECLNSIDTDMSLQLTVQTRRVDLDMIEQQLFYGMQKDGLDVYRREANQIITDRVDGGKSELVRQKFITISADGSLEDARRSLNQMESSLRTRWQHLGSQTRVLSGRERLELMNDMLNPGERLMFDYRELLTSGLTTKDAICPTSFSFREKSSFAFGSYYGQVLFAQSYEQNLSDELIHSLSSLSMEMVLTLHIRIIDHAKAVKLVESKISFMESEQVRASQRAISQNFDPEIALSYEFKHGYNEAISLLDDLRVRDQNMFKVTLLAYVYGKTREELTDKVRELCRVAKAKGVTFKPLDYQQEAGINSVLPIGKNLIPFERTMPTSAVSILIPFANQEIFQPGGICYGLNTISGNMIVLDRCSLLAANGMILGKTGSGKSFAAKSELVSLRLRYPDADIIIIDPEREYSALVQALGGSYIHISPGSTEHINPMDISMDYNGEDDPLLLKSSFVVSLCSLLLRGELTNQQLSLIDRACILVYRPYFSSNGKKPAPTLKEFNAMLKSFPEPEAKDIALALEAYIEGSLSAFSHPTNVDTGAQLVAYDVRDLGSSLKTLGMMVVLDQVWNRITQNRNQRRRTYFYIDEIQLLFSNSYCSDFFFELWSRARKYGAVPTGITQNVETMLNTTNARRMLSNCSFLLALAQNSNDELEALAQLLGISPEQARYMKSSEPGRGLLYAEGAVLPFVNPIPKNTELYRVLTTKLDEQLNL